MTNLPAPYLPLRPRTQSLRSRSTDCVLPISLVRTAPLIPPEVLGPGVALKPSTGRGLTPRLADCWSVIGNHTFQCDVAILDDDVNRRHGPYMHNECSVRGRHRWPRHGPADAVTPRRRGYDFDFVLKTRRAPGVLRGSFGVVFESRHHHPSKQSHGAINIHVKTDAVEYPVVGQCEELMANLPGDYGLVLI